MQNYICVCVKNWLSQVSTIFKHSQNSQ